MEFYAFSLGPRYKKISFNKTKDDETEMYKFYIWKLINCKI
jgi:hypothetical protein